MYYPKMFCGWCKEAIEPIEVHGHYQCTNCGKNVDECCQGETMKNETRTTGAFKK